MDVFIFQMGKVGSSAITRALCQRGVNAIQTHWLGKETLIGSLENSLLNVELEDDVAFRGAQEWMQNLHNTRKLLWYQKHHVRDGEKLRVVTLARDPLNWYWGHLAENFDLYGPCIQDWYLRVYGRDPGNMQQAAEVFHHALFENMGSINLALDDGGFAEAAVTSSYRGVTVHFLAEQMMKLRLPTVWFDVFFEPALGIDIYQAPLTGGTACFENEYAKVLLIRYEDLQQSLVELQSFLRLDELALEVTNPTTEKDLPFDIADFAREFKPDPRALSKLYDTPYCRQFGYHRELFP
ncbi:MAG: putative capsular polysaccharide synthesis family protein [Xanthomonadales bacterium]|nr:putative capsular polysaccharide synthesis family protein [Xanthomonadales bacterium]